MAGRPQPGIRDTRIPSTMASPYGRYAQYAQGAAQRAKSQDKKKKNDGGGNFITNELLGFDDFSWAVKNAQKGNWWDAAKSFGAGVLELGDTVASGAAIALSGGTATPLVAGKYAAKTAVKLGAKNVGEEIAQNVAKEQIKRASIKSVARSEKEIAQETAAKNRLIQQQTGGRYQKVEDYFDKPAGDVIKETAEDVGANRIRESVLRDQAREQLKLQKNNAKVEADNAKLDRKMDRIGARKMDTRDKTPAEQAKDLMDDLNPFQRQRLGQGKLRGKGKDGKGSTGETPGGTTGSQTPSSRPGGGTNRDGVNGSGGAGGAKELVTVGAKPAGVTRYADDFREPLSRPVQPKNTKPVQPGGSSSGGATQEAVEQGLKSELENLSPGMALPKGKLAPAGILGMGLGAQSGMQSGTTSQVTPSTATQTSTNTTTQTQTALGNRPMGTGGGGGGRRPYDIPGAGASGVDVTIPYTY